MPSHGAVHDHGRGGNLFFLREVHTARGQKQRARGNPVDSAPILRRVREGETSRGGGGTETLYFPCFGVEILRGVKTTCWLLEFPYQIHNLPTSAELTYSLICVTCPLVSTASQGRGT